MSWFLKTLNALLFGPKKHTCQTKRRFPDRETAEVALDRINPGRKLGKPLRSYKCPTCGGYHLTRSQKT